MKRVITIDGYSGCLKTAFANKLSQRLNMAYLSAGYIYRYITYRIINYGKVLVIDNLLQDIQREIILNTKGELIVGSTNLYSLDLNSKIINDNVSIISQDIRIISSVNNILTEFSKERSLIIDGRNLGFYVFSDATLKIFVESSVAERMNHLRLYNNKNGILRHADEYNLIENNMRSRDYYDENRDFQPLRCPTDAIKLNILEVSMAKALELIESEYFKKCNCNSNEQRI